MSRNGSNTRLIAWQDQAGLSNRALAELLARAADQAGVALTPSATQVAAWRNGQQPRARTAALIAQVIAARCECTITSLDLGFTAAEDRRNGQSPPSTAFGDLARAGQFAQGRLEMDRRTLIRTGLAAGASVAAAMDWMLPEWTTRARANAGRGTLVGASDAVGLWTEARALLAKDNQFGGRTVRPQALTLLNRTAIPLVQGRFASDAARQQVTAAVAYAGHLTAWTFLDCGDYPAAQRLLTASLAEAKRAGDAVVAAGIMSDLAHAEHAAGNPMHGALIASSAQNIGPERLPAAILARAAALEARCLAKAGDTQGTRRAMGRAEEFLGAGRGDDRPHILDFFFTEDQLHAELHVAYRELVVAGKTAPDTVLEHERLIGPAPHMGRRASMNNADAAIAHLIAGDLDAATIRADAAITAAAALAGGSGRVLGSLQRIRPHLQRYTATGPEARDLDRRLRQAAPLALAV